MNSLFIQACVTGNLEECKSISEQKVIPPITPITPITKEKGMIWASAAGHVEIIRFLLDEHPPSIDTRNRALEMAVSNGHLPVVRFWRDHGVTNRKAITGSITNGHLSVVQYFLSHEEYSPDQLRVFCTSAIINGHADILALLLDSGAPQLEEYIIEALNHQRVDIFHLLVRRGVGHIPIECVYCCYKADMAREILDSGHVEVDLMRWMKDCITFGVNDEDTMEMVRLLLERGCDPYRTLIYAIGKESESIVKLVLDFRAIDIHQNDNKVLKTALCSTAPILRLILSHGAIFRVGMPTSELEACLDQTYINGEREALILSFLPDSDLMKLAEDTGSDTLRSRISDVYLKRQYIQDTLSRAGVCKDVCGIILNTSTL